jgi:hypothetical protein
MADAPPDPAPPPSVIQRINNAAPTVGATGVALGSGTSLSGIIGWCFQCHEAGQALVPKAFFLIVTPDRTTIEVMAVGLILAGHGIKRAISSLLSGKHRRAADTA